MKDRDIGSEILALFTGREEESLSNSEIAELLENEVSSRSVSRYASKLSASGQLERMGAGRSIRYRLAKKTERTGSIFSAESESVLQRVNRPKFERQPISYQTEWLDSYQPNLTRLIPEEVSRELHEKGIRASEHDPAGTYARKIYDRLLIDLSFNSSRLEGNTYSQLDTERLVLQGASAIGKLEEETIMILNHKEAIRFLVEKASSISATSNTVCTLHYLLTDGLVESSLSGKVRNTGVRIGGSTYIPYERARELDRQLQKITKKAVMIHDPFEQSLFLLVHLSYLQAFIDGNKRTARLAANIPLITGNLVPQSFNEIRREDYSAAMIAVYECQEVAPIVDLYANSYLRTCEQYTATVEALGFDEIRVRYRMQRREALRCIVERLLVGNDLNQFIRDESTRDIPIDARESYMEDLMEDLRDISPSRIVGIGISEEQLQKWLQARERSL